MERSVVLFGPGDVGKSTLAGYLRAKLDPDFDLNRVISKVKKNGTYEESQKFAYIMDTAKDERKRTIESKKLGTSKYVHFERVKMDNYEITIIDTPGAQHIYNPKIRGIYYGDIGLFMVEAKKLTRQKLLSLKNMKTLQEFFMPLFIWLNFKSKENKLIILISKMDNVDFSEEDFNASINLIKTLCEEVNSANFIPISIDVKNEQDENVITKSNKMNWYFGPTLLSTLKDIYESQDFIDIVEPLFMTIETDFDRPLGRVLKGKIISGLLKNGDVINISPVYSNGCKIASAKVKNIRIFKGNDIEQAEKGSIITVLIDDIKIEGSRIRKDDFSISPTSAITDNNSAIKMGSIFKFWLPLEEAEKFSLREEIGILWFGRLIPTWVISKKMEPKGGYIYLEPRNIVASLISINGGFFFKNFLLKKGGEFKQANLVGIDYPSQLEFIVDDFEAKKGMISYYFDDFSFTIDHNKMIFKNVPCYSDLIARIKRFEGRFSEQNRNLYESVDLKLQ